MMKTCDTCLHGYLTKNKGMQWECNIGVAKLSNKLNCHAWTPDDPRVEIETIKPPLGCSPYYTYISARICELCEAIKRCSTESGKHNQIKLWIAEIHYLNEMDRMLRRTEKEKTWVENKDGTLSEVE